MEQQPSTKAQRRYKQAKTAVKCAVKQAEERAEEDSHFENKPQIARRKTYTVARERKEEQEDKVASPFMNNINGDLQVEREAASDRWREYFQGLLNEENPFTVKKPMVDTQPGISIAEVKATINKIKQGKAAGQMRSRGRWY